MKDGRKNCVLLPKDPFSSTWRAQHTSLEELCDPKPRHNHKVFPVGTTKKQPTKDAMAKTRKTNDGHMGTRP
jgi:hypothetical protein